MFQMHQFLYMTNQRFDIDRTRLAEVDYEVGMFFRYLSITDALAF